MWWGKAYELGPCRAVIGSLQKVRDSDESQAAVLSLVILEPTAFAHKTANRIVSFHDMQAQICCQKSCNIRMLALCTARFGSKLT